MFGFVNVLQKYLNFYHIFKGFVIYVLFWGGWGGSGECGGIMVRKHQHLHIVLAYTYRLVSSLVTNRAFVPSLLNLCLHSVN